MKTSGHDKFLLSPTMRKSWLCHRVPSHTFGRRTLISSGVLIAALGAFALNTVDAQQGQVSSDGVRIILENPGVPALGSPDALVTVVEYMDYNCPYCRRMAPDLLKLVAAEPDVRVLFKDWPVFGPVSEYAARAALASTSQGKYLAAYSALISTSVRLTSIDQVRHALKGAGIDLQALDRELQLHAAEIDGLLERNREEAAALGLRGTPGVIVGDLLVLGIVTYEQLQLLVSQIRAGR